MICYICMVKLYYMYDSGWIKFCLKKGEKLWILLTLKNLDWVLYIGFYSAFPVLLTYLCPIVARIYSEWWLYVICIIYLYDYIKGPALSTVQICTNETMSPCYGFPLIFSPFFSPSHFFHWRIYEIHLHPLYLIVLKILSICE